MCDVYKSPNINIPLVATIAAFRKRGKVIEVVLVRKGKPGSYGWSLPSGHAISNAKQMEDFSLAASRELFEETSLRIKPTKLKFVCERRRLNTRVKDDVLYTALFPSSSKIQAGDDAEHVEWRNIQSLPPLAFDHNLFIEEALRVVFSKKKKHRSVNYKAVHAPASTNRGFLIVFEGLDGSGKTTQIKRLRDQLQSLHIPVETTRWASSDILKKAIKNAKENSLMDNVLYSLIHAADMNRRYTTEILKWLGEGKVVICDRYIYSSFVRDMARNVDPELLNIAYQNFRKPNVLIYCSAPANVTLDRLKEKKGFSYYGTGLDLHLNRDPVKNCQMYQKIVRELYEDILPKIDTYIEIKTNHPEEKIAAEINRKVLSKVRRWKTSNT